MSTTRLFTFVTAALLGASLILSPIVSVAAEPEAGINTSKTAQVAMTRHHRSAAHCRMHCRSMTKHHMKRHHHRHHQHTTQR